MPFGSFLILINANAEIERQAVYIEEGATELNLGKNELLKIRMAHSDKSVALTILPDAQIYSYKKEYKDKKVIFQLIGGLFLNKDENSGQFKDKVQSFVESMFDKKNLPNEELKALIGENYKKYFQQQQFVVQRDKIEKELTERSMVLNTKGKFDDAKEILAKIQKGLPAKMVSAYEAGEKFIKNQEYERAEKEYESAMRLASDLGMKDHEKYFNQKKNLSRKIPSLLKKREECLEKAMNGLRTDHFDDASKYFKQAAEISGELMETRRMEEYNAKAKILAEYMMIDKKYAK